MTAIEMQYNFELKIGEFHQIGKTFTSTDVQTFLNEAMINLVDSRYSAKVQPGSIYFEKDEKTRKELFPLIMDYIAESEEFDSDSEELHPNAVFVDLPDDYMYPIKEMVMLSYEDCNDTAVTAQAKVLPLRYDEYLANIDNPFAKPYKKLVWRLDFGLMGVKQHELIHGEDEEIVSYHLRYLKQPEKIDIINEVDCELHESVHQEIVDRAIQLAIMSLKLHNSINQKQTS